MTGAFAKDVVDDHEVEIVTLKENDQALHISSEMDYLSWTPYKI